MFKWMLSLGIFVLAVMPSSATKQLNNYSFGSGGTGGSSSATYSVDGVTGEQSSLQVNSSTKGDQPGNNYIQSAAVPTLTLTNTTNYYNKLALVINPGSNPSDTLFAVAISTNNFTSTNYVKSDNTIGSTLVYPTDYRTYSGWGSATGVFVIGLTSNTTYYVKAKAIQGKFTETGYGPVVSAATVNPQLSFSLRTGAQASPPFSIGFGTLLVGSVSSALDQANITFASNAESGGSVYVGGQNSALTSASTGGSVAAVNGDLSALGSGFGAQASANTQTSGGPFNKVGPNFNGSSNNVGAMTVLAPIFNTANPVVGAAGSILLKAKVTTTTPATSDYTEIMTLVASGSF